MRFLSRLINKINKSLYLSVRVFSTVVLIVDTVNKQTNITSGTFVASAHNKNRKCKLAAISAFSQKFGTCLKLPRYRGDLKMPLVYTWDFYRELERNKSCIGKRGKNRIKKRLCERTFSYIYSLHYN